MPVHDALSCPVTMYILYGVRLTVAIYGISHKKPTAQLTALQEQSYVSLLLSWNHAVKISQLAAHVAVRYISLTCPALNSSMR